MKKGNDKANMIKCQQLENLGDRYMGVLCTILAIFLLSFILFSRKKKVLLGLEFPLFNVSSLRAFFCV